MRTRPVVPHEMKLFSEYHAQFAVAIVHLTEEIVPHEDVTPRIVNEVRPFWAEQKVKEITTDPAEWRKEYVRLLKWALKKLEGSTEDPRRTVNPRRLSDRITESVATTNPHIKFIKSGNKDLEDQGWKGPGWYFWDETEAFCHGPYPSFEEAKEGLNKYIQTLINESH